MYKLLLFFTCLFLLFSQTYCSKSEQRAVRPAGKKDNKPQNDKDELFDVAPTYSESQLQINQWIEWKRTSPQNTVDCMRWIITDFPAAGIELESRISYDCKTYDDSHVEHIKFNRSSGKIIDLYCTTRRPDGSEPTVSCGEDQIVTIFDHIYGNKQKVKFKKGIIKLNKRSYPAFQLKNQSPIFLNQPQTPFHAFVLSWSHQEGSSQNGRWIYEMVQTFPAIP